MINIIEQVGANRILNNGPDQYVFYSQRIDLDLNTVRSLFSKYRIKANIEENYNHNFSGENIKCVKINSDGKTLYMLDSVHSFNFNGMPDLISNVKKFGTENVILENNGIQIRPSLFPMDRYNFKTVENEIVSVGNFMVHFGDFMDSGDVQSFVKDLHRREAGLIEILIKAYAPILKKTNFEQIMGYASVNKFHKKIINEDVIDNYNPMTNSKYCIMLNDSPMKLSFNRIDNGVLILEASIAGSFRYRHDLPNFEPYIILTPKKMPSIPSIPYKTKVPDGNSTKTIVANVSILKFTKPQIINESNYSIDLLSLAE